MGSGGYKIRLTEEAIQDLQFWHKSGQKAIINKIEQLILAIQDNPTSGIGKPELLKHNLSGKYSRRINKEHRIVYEIQGDVVYIHSLKDHY